LDRHAVRIACPDAKTAKDAQRILGWAGAYDLIADAYRIAADREGIAPHQMQAITWIAYRDLAGRLDIETDSSYNQSVSS
jgi:hypothetical protein